jgi:hypothetical protein
MFKINTLFLFLSVFAVMLCHSGCATSHSNDGGSGLDLSRSYERIDSDYSYKNLFSKDLEQMTEILQSRTRENSVNRNLREAAYIAFARPNEDGSLEKFLAEARDPLEDEEDWTNTIETLVRQSIDDLKNADLPPAKQVTAGVILENIISELKPLYKKQYQTGGFETDIINFIARSEAEYSKPARKERALSIMRNNLNPSQIALKLLDQKKASQKK